MRVLHLDAGKEMRGGQWQVLRLIEGLAAEGVESTLLARRGAPLYQAARKLGWAVHGIGLARATLAVRRHDLVHAHDARGHTLGALLRGASLLVSRRVAFPIGGSGSSAAQRGSRWKYGRAAHYLAVSEFVKSVLAAGGVPEDKISVVYDGVPLLNPVVPVSAFQIIAPSTAGDPRKGTPLAVQAAALAGVELRFSTNLERDLAHARLMLYVSHSEGLGSGVLLAMSAGVPVVASRVGGLTEIIRHGENGILVDNQPDALADAIRQVLDNPGLALKMGTAGRQAIIEKFTVSHMVRRTMEIYRQVLL